MAGTTPERWHTREDSGLTLDGQLRWWHDGEPIEHPNIIEAFNRGLRVEDDGRYTLHIGADWCFVEVEDAGFGVVAVDVSENGRLSLRLSDRTAEWLEPSSLSVADDGVLRARVKSGRARARFSRDAQFQLVQLLELDGDRLVTSGRREPTSLPASLLTAE